MNTRTAQMMPARRLTAARMLLGGLALAGFNVGGWADANPASFYRSFPGFGRHWLTPLGPFNEHLVRDFGSLNLGLAVAALVAAICLTRSATVTASLAWLAYLLPHLAFHATHGEMFSAGENTAVLLSLVAPGIAAAVALYLVLSAPRPTHTNSPHAPASPTKTKVTT